MFGSSALEVTIGLSLFFLITSLICSAVCEAIEALLKTRAKHLERGIRELLDDPSGETLTRSIFEHGQVFSLFVGGYDPARLRSSWRFLSRPREFFSYWRARRRLPSYIPAGQFAGALMDIIARGPGNWPYPVAAEAMTVERLRQQAAYLPNGRVQRAVLSAIDFGNNDLATVKHNLERWFDGSMDRVSGWYKRTTEMWLFCIGLAAAILLNLDAYGVARTLVHDEAVRDAFVAQAEAVQQAGAEAAVAPRSVGELRAQIVELGAPIGWSEGTPLRGRPVQMCPEDGAGPPGCVTSWGRVSLGWLLTAIAVMFGAPFWFDVLNKFMVIRSTVKPREKSPEEASEDRQQRPATTIAAGAGGGPAGGPAGGGAAGAATPVTPAAGTGAPPSADELVPAEAGFVPEEWKPGVDRTQEISL